MSRALHSNLGHLGDNLILTPLLRSGLFDRVRIPDDATCRSAAQVYENIVPVEFVSGPELTAHVHCPETQERTHRTRRYLNRHGLSHLSPLPYVVLTDAEVAAARNLLAPYRNPLVVNFTTFDGPVAPCTAMRAVPQPLAEWLTSQADQRGYTCLNIGLSKNYRPVPNVVPLLDLSVRQAAACFHVIGRYLGGESGPNHLMIAAGGRSIVLHPDWHDLLYPGWMCTYTPDMFGAGPVRARNLSMRDHEEAARLLSFDW